MAGAALLVGWLNRRQIATVVAVVPKIAELEKNTNSIKDALVASTRETALLEGHEAGRIAGKAEEKQDAKA